jgi:predicted phosphohydrolase
MRIIALSDSHTLHQRVKVPDGDVLVFAGDMGGHGDLWELVSFNKWIGELPHRHKIVIAGNHDFIFERQHQLAVDTLTSAVYLQDSSITIDGVSFYGSPWQPEFCQWAFNLPRSGEQLNLCWSKVPTGVDVLITHGPPNGILDTVRGHHVGCEILRVALKRIRPKIHIFGHLHDGYGRDEVDGTVFANVAICDESYDPVNRPQVIEMVEGPRDAAG